MGTTEAELREGAALLRLELRVVGPDAFELFDDEDDEDDEREPLFTGTAQQVSEWLTDLQRKLGADSAWFQREPEPND